MSCLSCFSVFPRLIWGGELVIEKTEGETAYKLKAGLMLVYPSSEVQLVMVEWTESLVRESA